MLKYFTITLLLISLSGCAVIKEREENSRICSNLSKDLKRDDSWKNSCVNDSLVMLEGLKSELEVREPKSLCQTAFIYDDKPYGIEALSVSKKRKINCAPFFSQFSEQVVNSSNVASLCQLWSANTGPNELRIKVRKEVKARSADCPSMLAALAQQQQAIAQQEQAAAANRAAFAALQANIQNNINANRPRTCYGGYNSVTCY